MGKVVITGANKGIGLGLAREYVNRGHEVIATCRREAPELKSLDLEVYENLELSDMKCIDDFVNFMEDKGTIDILINNAALPHFYGKLESPDDILEHFKVNTIAPVYLTQRLFHHFEEGSKVIMISSRMGSIDDNESGGHYGFRGSKSALNSISVSMGLDYRKNGIIVGIIHPGFVKTDNTFHNGNLTPETAAKAIYKNVRKLRIQDTANFWHINGASIPW